MACQAVSTLYGLTDYWIAQGRPREGVLKLEPHSTVWGESMSYERRPGPRDRYHWVREWAPMATFQLVDSVLFIVFRGTVTNHDWSNNFRFPSRRFEAAGESFGEVHDGFGDCYESMREDLMESMGVLIGWANPARVVIAGHSLGGAVATLAYADLSQRIRAHPVSGIVFGSPRVGSPGFAQAFKSLPANATAFTRFEIERDPVPKLPPAGVLGVWRFDHVGRVIRLDIDNGSDRANHVISAYRTAIEGQPVDGAAVGDGLTGSQPQCIF